MRAMVLRLDSPCKNMRIYAAAAIRTACINCPENRDAVYEAGGVRRLLYYVGEEMADVISEALGGDVDISTRLKLNSSPKLCQKPEFGPKVQYRVS
jgi:hypothetical protein